MRPAFIEAFKLDKLENVSHTFVNVGLGQILLLEAERDVAGDAEVRKQRVALEHHVDRPAVRRHIGYVPAIKQDTTLARLLEAGEHAQQCRLAGT